MDERLVGFAELPALLDVSRATAQRYSKRPDFPHPVQRIAAGPVWSATAVEEWARQNLPVRRGRPPRR